MASNGRVRIEIGFDGGQIMSALVDAGGADRLEQALADLADEGAELIDEEPRQGLFGLEVAFVHPESVHGVLAEVVSGG